MTAALQQAIEASALPQEVILRELTRLMARMDRVAR